MLKIKRLKKLFLKKRKEANRIKVPNPKESDIYLISYPKSGNTWMRYLLAYAIWPELENIDLVQMGSYIPSYGIKNDIEAMRNEASPCNQLRHRIIKEHIAYINAPEYIERVIYIVRDGRDAIVSYWHFCNQRDNTSIPFGEFIRTSADTNHSYGPWRKHVKGWMNANLKDALIIRYEDLLDNTSYWLARALEFSEIKVSSIDIESAVQKASFESLRKIQETKGFNLDQLNRVDFIRSGKTGAWKHTFGEEDMEKFIEYHGKGIPEIGYSW